MAEETSANLPAGRHGVTGRAGEAAAFRVRVEERLRSLESELAEVKSRINGLLFFIAGTVIAQALLRLLA